MAPQAEQATEKSETKRAVIHRAAVAEFSARGFAGTSMANIADAAGMSRPALYQYFRNKTDIFSSAFVGLLSDHADEALRALCSPGTVAEQLDGFLQRFDGDLFEHMSASPFADEVMRAKSDLSDGVDPIIDRLWDGCGAYLAETVPGRSAVVVARREGWIEVLRFSRLGFKVDQPTVAVFRRRLSALAQTVAADIATT